MRFLHHTGDEALIAFANILKSSVNEDDFVARTGGDEFAIIFESKNTNRLEQIIDNINKSLEKFNQEKDKPYELHVSTGGLVFDENTHKDLTEFFKLLDRSMYQMKELHHKKLRILLHDLSAYRRRMRLFICVFIIFMISFDNLSVLHYDVGVLERIN